MNVTEKNNENTSRLTHSARNSFFGVLRTLILLLAKFAVRTVFIYVLGEELLGLDNLFTSVLSVLSIADLGFGSAVVYNMYKPVADGDKAKVAALLRFYRKVYAAMGIFILVAGLILLPFLPYLINGEAPVGVNIYIVYVTYLLNAVVAYFFAYKRSLLYANQRNDVENRVSSLCIILLHASQIALLILFKNIYLFCVLLPIFTLLENVIVSRRADKMFGKPYRDARGELSPDDKRLLKRSVFAMAGHKIGFVVVQSTDSILISAVFGLAVVSKYNNYFLIIAAVASLINILVQALTASIGNSVATETPEKNYKNYMDLTFLFFWIIAFCSSSFISLFKPFMTLWLGESFLLEPTVVVALVVSFALSRSRCVTNAYCDTTGTFYNDRFKPIVEAITNLIMSLVFAVVLDMGLAGVVYGTIFSILFVAFPWEIYVLFRYYFKRSAKDCLIKMLVYAIVGVAVCALNYYVCSFIPTEGVLFFIARVGVCAVLPNAVFLLLSHRTKEFAYFKGALKRIAGVVTGRKSKKMQMPIESVEESAIAKDKDNESVTKEGEN